MVPLKQRTAGLVRAAIALSSCVSPDSCLPLPDLLTFPRPAADSVASRSPLPPVTSSKELFMHLGVHHREAENSHMPLLSSLILQPSSFIFKGAAHEMLPMP